VRGGEKSGCEAPQSFDVDKREQRGEEKTPGERRAEGRIDRCPQIRSKGPVMEMDVAVEGLTLCDPPGNHQLATGVHVRLDPAVPGGEEKKEEDRVRKSVSEDFGDGFRPHRRDVSARSRIALRELR